jgi:hypothetical protein
MRCTSWDECARLQYDLINSAVPWDDFRFITLHWHFCTKTPCYAVCTPLIRSRKFRLPLLWEILC